MHPFRQFIANYSPLTDEEWMAVENAIERVEFSRNQLILHEGDICRYFYFLEKGLVRYFIIHEGNDITKFFTVAPYCFTSQHSFKNRVPALESIHALEDLVAWRMPLEKVAELGALPLWTLFTRKFLQEVQFNIEELMMQARTGTAGTRYKRLAEQYPHVINRIPLKYMAGFLGIAPQSLSRIRKKDKNRETL